MDYRQKAAISLAISAILLFSGCHNANGSSSLKDGTSSSSLSAVSESANSTSSAASVSSLSAPGVSFPDITYVSCRDGGTVSYFNPTGHPIFSQGLQDYFYFTGNNIVTLHTVNSTIYLTRIYPDKKASQLLQAIPLQQNEQVMDYQSQNSYFWILTNQRFIVFDSDLKKIKEENNNFAGESHYTSLLISPDGTKIAYSNWKSGLTVNNIDLNGSVLVKDGGMKQFDANTVDWHDVEPLYWSSDSRYLYYIQCGYAEDATDPTIIFRYDTATHSEAQSLQINSVTESSFQLCGNILLFNGSQSNNSDQHFAYDLNTFQKVDVTKSSGLPSGISLAGVTLSYGDGQAAVNTAAVPSYNSYKLTSDDNKKQYVAIDFLQQTHYTYSPFILETIQ